MSTTPTPTPAPAATTPAVEEFYCSACGHVARFLSSKLAKTTQPPICPLDSRTLKPMADAADDPSVN